MEYYQQQDGGYQAEHQDEQNHAQQHFSQDQQMESSFHASHPVARSHTTQFHSDQPHLTTNSFRFRHQGKRPRESTMLLSEGDSRGMQHSFKRLRVMDEATHSDTSATDFLYSTMMDHAHTPLLRDEYAVPSSQPAQSAGQQSCEPSSSSSSSLAGYQSMNSMLGNLHLMRRQRVVQPPAEPSATDMDHFRGGYHENGAVHQPPGSQQASSSSSQTFPLRQDDYLVPSSSSSSTRKKSTSLRISSKLF